MENVKFDEDENNVYVNITLNKKDLKLLKELHGNITVNEYFQEIAEFIKEKTNHFHKSYDQKSDKNKLKNI
jgi:hypothetical protein